MDSEPSHDLPRLDSASALLAEVETAVALMELAKISTRGETERRIYENTKKSYELVLTLLPAALRTMSHHEELAMWARLAPVREWIESRGRWSRIAL
jgi:hypothetical protein